MPCLMMITYNDLRESLYIVYIHSMTMYVRGSDLRPQQTVYSYGSRSPVPIYDFYDLPYCGASEIPTPNAATRVVLQHRSVAVGPQTVRMLPSGLIDLSQPEWLLEVAPQLRSRQVLLYVAPPICRGPASTRRDNHLQCGPPCMPSRDPGDLC